MKIDIIKTINPDGKIIEAAPNKADYLKMVSDMKKLGIINPKTMPLSKANEMIEDGTFYDYAESVGYRFERLQGIITNDDPL
jgi:hypothetical protein